MNVLSLPPKAMPKNTVKGQVPREIGNRGVSDSSMMPPSISFAARGSATPDGDPILAHHFSLLDNDMMHEHSLLQIHVPENGTPHAFLGWTGLVWGFSGMNSEGLAYAVNNSDSLDNPLVGRTLDAIFENIGDLIADPNLEGSGRSLAIGKTSRFGYCDWLCCA